MPSVIYTNQLAAISGGQINRVDADDTIVLGTLPVTISLDALTGAVSAVSVSSTSGAFSGNVTIGGNLTVTGAITSVTKESIVIGDNFIDLNAQNALTTPAFAGGLSVNIVAATPTVVGSSDVSFVAGSESVPTSNPYIEVTSAAGFAADQLIQVFESVNGKNDGQYVVESVDTVSIPNRIYVKGTTLMPMAVNNALTPFAHNQFEAQSNTSATVTRATFSVISASNGTFNSNGISAGTWAWAYGTVESDFATWNSLASTTLQAVYNNSSPATILLADTKTFTIAPPTGPSEYAGFSIVGNADSAIGVDAGTLTIGSSNTLIDLNGAVRVPGEGNVVISQTIAAGTLGGEICYINASGQAQKFGSGSQYFVAGVAAGTVGSWGDCVQTIRGSVVTVGFTSTIPVLGDVLYLSATAGKAQVGPPASGRIYRIGVCVRAAGIGDTDCGVIFDPQYIADV